MEETANAKHCNLITYTFPVVADLQSATDEYRDLQSRIKKQTRCLVYYNNIK